MLDVFGEFDLALGSNGRFAFPIRLHNEFIKAKINRLIFVRYDSALFGFTPETFGEYMRTYAQPKGIFDDDSLAMTRGFFGSAIEADIDESGRCVLGERLRSYAKLEKEVTLISVLDRLEIWNPERWKGIYESSRERIVKSGEIKKLARRATGSPDERKADSYSVIVR